MEFYSNGRTPERSMAEAASAFSNIVRTQTESEIMPLTFNENTKLGLNNTEVIPDNIKTWAESFRKYLAQTQNSQEESTEETSDKESVEDSSKEPSEEIDGTYHTKNSEEEFEIPKDVEKKLPETKGRDDNKNKAQTSKYAGKAYLFAKDYFKAGYNLGLSKNFIKNMFVKDILESGWGAKNQSPYNFGNIKATKNWKGNTVEGKDHDSEGNTISAKYKSYNSIEDYLRDEVALLKNTYKIKESDSIKTFTEKLLGLHRSQKKYKYATDPGYLNKILNNFMSCQKYNIFNYV